MWRDADDYASVLTSFVEDGLAAGEAVMVAVVRRHANWLREWPSWAVIQHESSRLGKSLLINTPATADPYAVLVSQSGPGGVPRKSWNVSWMRAC